MIAADGMAIVTGLIIVGIIFLIGWSFKARSDRCEYCGRGGCHGECL